MAVCAVVLLAAACDRPEEDAIETVPPPTEESANRLMSTAEQAARDAAARGAGETANAATPADPPQRR